MKRTLYFLLLLFLIGCNVAIKSDEAFTTLELTTEAQVKFNAEELDYENSTPSEYTSTDAVLTNEEFLEPELTFTPTVQVTYTPVPAIKPTDLYVTQIKAIMELYNLVDVHYLSDSYWELLTTRINDYGVANRIIALEYHGNNYWMYDGAYSMTPETFHKQMEYLMQNDFHFVTIHELKGFLEGWLDLPKRSIILTTDSGYTSQNSMPSITSQFSELEKTYGYRPHMQSYIWTKFMTPEETSNCKNDSCWEAFRIANQSGYFTFGTHSETHPYFEEKTLEFTQEDLIISLNKIYDNIGVNAYAITWPHESCSPYLDMLDGIGINIGFGGRSKPISDCYTYKQDEMRLCLPRLFPPHGGGISARPAGMTLQEMLEAQISQ